MKETKNRMEEERLHMFRLLLRVEESASGNDVTRLTRLNSNSRPSPRGVYSKETEKKTETERGGGRSLI